MVANISQFDLQRIFDIAEDTANRALRSTYPRFVIEAGIIKMATISDLKPLVDVLKGEVRVENKQPIAKSTKAEKVAAPVKTLSSSNVSNSSDFNPNWEEYLNFLSRQGLMRLQAYLRRVSPLEFRQGLLKLEAVEFDLSALNDPDMLSQLKNSLVSYSEHAVWDLQLIKLESVNVAPGSEVEKEREETKKRRQKIAKEAVDDPALKDVLAAFEGAQVEKVSILK